jgi:hypothetical protein
MTQAVVGSSCEANLFEPIEDGCEGRWSYRNPSECYEEARHPACGYELLPGSRLECDETKGVFTSYEDCSLNRIGTDYIISDTNEPVEVRLVSEYMQVLYGSDANAALTDIQNILGDVCGAYGIKEIGEIAKQCAPLARGVGEQDELDDLLTSLGVITKTLDHIRACPQVSGNPLKSLEFRGTSAYLGLECRRQEDDFNRLASWLEQLRGCPSNATNNLVATLMSTFYQHVASNLEEVVGQYCTPEAQQGVYIEIMEAIERYLGGAGWEEYIQGQLELQCEQKCRERLKYTNSDGEDVYMLDARCETSVENVTEASAESGAIFAGECQMTIQVPSEYRDYLSEKTCRTKENGVTDPSECGVAHAGEEVHYTGLGLEREQVLRMYEGDVVPQTLQCLTGDDIAVDWTNVSPLELSALKSRILTSYLDRDATSGADGESMKDMLAARLMLLSELYGDGPLHKGESQADSKNKAFILNTAELYERHPNARPSCGPELDGSGNCNQDGSATVNVTGLSNSFAVGHGLSENSLFAYPLGIVSIPFGFHGYDFLMLDPTAPSPDTQSTGYAEFAVDRPTTVTILFDRAGANYRSYLVDQGWEIQEVDDLVIFDISDGSKAAYYAATKDFAESASVMRTLRIPGHEISFNGNQDTNTKRPIILFRSMDIEAVVDMCHRYTDEQILDGMDSDFHHPIVERCTSRFNTGLDVSSEMDARAGVSICTDFAAEHAAEDVSEILAFDIPLRSNVIVPADSNIPPGNAAKLDQQVLRLDNWVKSVEGHATPKTLYQGTTDVLGAVHGSLGTVLPIPSNAGILLAGGISFSDTTPAVTNDPQKATRESLQLRYRDSIVFGDDLDLRELLSRWQYDTHREVINAAKRTSASEYLHIMASQDALELVTSKLDAHSELFDLVCILSNLCGRDSNTGELKETSVTKLWNLLRYVLDPDADSTYWSASFQSSVFNTQRPDDNEFRVENVELFKLLLDLKNEREKLKDYVLISTGESLASFPNTDPELILTQNPEIYRLYKVANLAKTRRINYSLYGLMSDKAHTVRTGLDDENIFNPSNGVLAQLAGKTAALETSLNDYENNRISDQQTRLSLYDNEQQQESLKLKKIQLFDELNYQKNKLDFLRRLLKEPKDRKSDYMAQAFERSTDPSFVNSLGFTTSRATPLFTEVTNASAKLSGEVTNNTLLASLSVPWDVPNGAALTVQKGNFITVNVSGEYAPDCALRIARPTGDSLNLSPQINFPVFIETQGYRTTVTASGYEVSSVTDSNSWSGSAGGSAQACVGTPAGDLSPFNIRGCLEGSVHKSWSRTNSDTIGNELRESTTMVEGLRVNSHVPFVLFPAGSLLLVGVDSTISNPTVEDVEYFRVLSGGPTSFVVPKNTKFFLIVNDQSHDHPDCNSKTDPAWQQKHVSVSTSIYTLVSGVGVLDFADEMIDVFGDIQNIMNDIASTDESLPSHIDGIRNNARNRFYGRFGGESSIPEGLRLIFDYWLSQEIASLELRVSISQHIRTILNTANQLNSLEQDLTSNSGRRGYLERIQTLNEEHFYRKDYFNRSIEFIEFISDIVMPILWLKYDNYIDGLPMNEVNELKVILNSPSSIELDELASKISILFGPNSYLYDRINTAYNNNAGSMTDWVAVYFPKDFSSTTSHVASVRDPVRSDLIWDRFENTTNNNELIQIKIEPEDLYLGLNNMGYNFVLPCNKVEPIVKEMILIFVAEGVQYTSLGVSSNARQSAKAFSVDFGDAMVLARGNGPRNYLMDNETYQGSTINTGYLRDVELDYPPNPDLWINRAVGDGKTGEGLSPFMEMSIRESNIYSVLGISPLDFYNDMDGLLVFLKIQGPTVSTNLGVSWISGCENY